jgi:hypothetical protein
MKVKGAYKCQSNYVVTLHNFLPLKPLRHPLQKPLNLIIRHGMQIIQLEPKFLMLRPNPAPTTPLPNITPST